MEPFGARLAAAVEARGSQVVVGVDPDPARLWPTSGARAPEARALLEVAEGDPRSETAVAVLAHCLELVEAAAPACVAAKPQLAFFEQLGAFGWRALEHVCAHARANGLIVLADAKRGDIGSTARAYAAAYLEPRGDAPPVADAMTANLYLGRDSLEPYLAACRRHGAGLFCLLKTSNEGGADVQDLVLSDGRPAWHHISGYVRELGEELVGGRGLSSVGAVVGATHPRAVGEARRLMPQTVFLLPGVGAQGGSPADLARAFTSGPASALVSASRSVLYAFRSTDEDWRTAAALEAARLRREVWAVAGW